MNAMERDAREFGLHSKQEGWRLGLLVARNVVKAPGRVAVETLRPKVNATEFARQSSTTNDRVLRHLKAWDKAAEDGIVPPSSSLKPGTEIDLDASKLPPWTDYYEAVTGGYNGGKERTPSKAQVESVLSNAPAGVIERVMASQPASKQAALAQSVLNNPGVVDEFAKTKGAHKTAVEVSEAVRTAIVDRGKQRRRTTRTNLSDTVDSLGVLVDVIGNLFGAKRRLNDAYVAMRDLALNRDQKEAVIEEVAEIRLILDWIESYVESGDQSFEDELSKLLTKEE